MPAQGAETLITYPSEYIANRDGVRQEREPLLWEAVTRTYQVLGLGKSVLGRGNSMCKGLVLGGNVLKTRGLKE